MKPLEIAKNIWKHACEEQRKITNQTYTSSKIYSYYGILSMYSAAQAAFYGDDSQWMDEVLSMLDRYPFDFDAPDIFFNYNFDNYRVGGLGKPWLCMKEYFDEKHIDAVREYAEKTLAAPRSNDEIICYPDYKFNHLVWIDVAFGVCPYMAFAGKLLNEEKYVEFAVEQCFKMYDVLIDNSNGLLHQTRGFMPPDLSRVSHDHWSRGNGWGYIGLAETMRYLPEDSPYYEETIKRFKAHSEALLKYQDHRGLWRQSIAEKLAWEESSGTGLILYGFGMGMRLGILDKDKFMPAFKRGVDALIKYFVNEDYSVDGCCHGCLCPGDTPERKGTLEAYLVDVFPIRDDGHAFGPVILTMVEAYRNGICNIETV